VRKVGHDRRLPIIVPVRSSAQPEPDECETCERGYSWWLSIIMAVNDERQRRVSETKHGHLFIELSPELFGHMVWETHCERCHEAGEPL
jgi:hypothetical protein